MSEWWKGGVIYQVYPRSFCDSDGDGQGDLQGIISKLDYIASLGVDAIWFSPLYPSPNADWGYDVSDYFSIHPDFGTMDDFDQLVSECKARNLRIILDQVLSHTSSSHPWFQDSLKGGEKSDWYVWANPKPDGGPPNNWLSDFGGPAWKYQPQRRQYYHHKFVSDQPALNYHNPQVRQMALDVLDFWLKRGVDGFRLDVSNAMYHDASLADNPPVAMDKRTKWHWAMASHLQRHLHDSNRPETLDMYRDIRALCERYNGAFVLAENHEEFSKLAEYYNHPDSLHSFYTPELNRSDLGPSFLADFMDRYSAMDQSWPCVTMSNHDYVRPAGRHTMSPGFPADLAHQARFFLTILFALRGTVLMYQGEELGLPQARFSSIDETRDPVAHLAWQAYQGRDGSRTPMPWTARGENAGFSPEGAGPWLAIAESHRPLAVDQQTADPGSTLAFTQSLVKLRHEHAALRTCDFKTIRADETIWHVERCSGDERISLVFCFGDQPVNISSKSPPLFTLGSGQAAMRAGDIMIFSGPIWLTEIPD